MIPVAITSPDNPIDLNIASKMKTFEITNDYSINIFEQDNNVVDSSSNYNSFSYNSTKTDQTFRI